MPIFCGTFALLALLLWAYTGSALPSDLHAFRSTPSRTWSHPQGHPIHALFRRQNATVLSTDGTYYPQVGSPSMFLHDFTLTFIPIGLFFSFSPTMP
jgi:hypothetical protein